MPRPSAANTRQCHGRRLRDRIPERCAHERRGAGRSDHGRQARRSQCCRASVLPCRRCAVAELARREPKRELERAEQVQPDREEQQREHDDDPGRLQLESPAELGAALTEARAGAGEQEEGRDHARRVGQAVQAQAGMRPMRGIVFAIMLDQRQQLERQHREDAGHEIEQQAAQQRARAVRRRS